MQISDIHRNIGRIKPGIRIAHWNEDGFKVGCREAGCIPFYSPCCGGAPGRHFPCKHLIGPPPFYARASNPPPFCAGRASQGGVQKVEVPADYPDLSPNPRSRQYHATQDEFRRGFKRAASRS